MYYSCDCGIDLFDVVCTLVSDIYTLALRPAALGLRCIYQANPSCPCYNLQICIYVYVYVYIIKYDST